jgi:hypothetical protein
VYCWLLFEVTLTAPETPVAVTACAAVPTFSVPVSAAHAAVDAIAASAMSAVYFTVSPSWFLLRFPDAG